IVGGSAVNGTDYSTIPTSVVIPAGATNVKIPITVIDDPQPEGMERILVQLSTVSPPFTIGTNNLATVDITDNDTVKTAAWMSYRLNSTKNTVSAGDPIFYTIHISNGSDSDQVNIVVKDRIPAYTTFVSAECGK